MYASLDLNELTEDGWNMKVFDIVIVDGVHCCQHNEVLINSA